jgi:hypothetical protein
MRTLQKPVTKDHFVEILEFACKKRTLIFSQDPEGNFWPIPGSGLSKEEERIYITDAPPLLLRIAQIHSEECPEGGKFRVTFSGGWSLAQRRWFVIWEKARDLVLYEHSVPLTSAKYVDAFAAMAKRDPSAD